MSITIMFTKCDNCGYVYKFYPEGMKIYCPKCLHTGPGEKCSDKKSQLILTDFFVKKKDKE